MKRKIWSKEEISAFCLELSLLLKAGLPAEICFSILADEETDAEKKQVLEELYDKLKPGEKSTPDGARNYLANHLFLFH